MSRLLAKGGCTLQWIVKAHSVVTFLFLAHFKPCTERPMQFFSYETRRRQKVKKLRRKGKERLQQKGKAAKVKAVKEAKEAKEAKEVKKAKK